ncbi:hypothetical protein B2J93_7623 [Marssonina coronariae]|uniref:cyclin-dependent kinase n=1 Tax=Diplocarpon coronariae TaxID=2795749 RepID=A0A218Z8M4_9HELO|nr:hypothetical protein B2J93_7623 [Marssonina coronariae]
MASAPGWRSCLGATERYENIEKLKKCIEAKGLSSTGTAHKSAFAVETEAYNTSESREAYDIACSAITKDFLPDLSESEPQSKNPGITIGIYADCQHIATGLVAEVYRCKTVALKVITETRNIEPHRPSQEVKILNELSHPSVIKLNETFKDSEGRLVLVFPFFPLTLAKVIGSGSVPEAVTKSCFRDLLSALSYLHKNGIIHRDIKPSNLLLASGIGPAYLSDFGTTWHPSLSAIDEPPHHKVLEVGTTCYRAPETLFGNRAYSTSLDMWAAGAMLVECLRKPPKTLFESRETSEDGNQLGLILSIFKTIGTPTEEVWPEAKNFSTPPFNWYQEFPGNSWEELLPDASENARDLVRKLVCFEGGKRATAIEASAHPYFSAC